MKEESEQVTIEQELITCKDRIREQRDEFEKKFRKLQKRISSGLEIQEDLESQIKEQVQENQLLLLQLLQVQDELENLYLKYQVVKEVKERQNNEKDSSNESRSQEKVQSTGTMIVSRLFIRLLRKIYQHARQSKIFGPFARKLRDIYWKRINKVD